MTAQNPDNARSVTKYTGQNYTFTPAYMRSRDPTVNDLRDPKNQGYYPFTALWINKTNQNLWALVKIANNLATWIMLSGGSGGPIINLGVDIATAPGVNPVAPTGAGLITINGKVVAAASSNASSVLTNSVALNQFNIEVKTSQALAAPDITKIGLSNFDSADFQVDLNGFVQLKGGSAPAIQQITVDGTSQIITPTNIPPENITITGNTVANAFHTPAKALYFNKVSTSVGTLDIQLSTADTVGASTSAHAGVASFNTNNFTVDANGFVTSKSGFTLGVTNLGIAYSAGVFTIHGANGNALSVSNPAFVTIHSAITPGNLVTIAVTSNQTFQDHAGTGQTDGNSWGTSSGAWTNDCPFYIYAVVKSDDSAIAFTINRVPHMEISSTTIAYTGSATAASPGAMFGLGLVAGTVAAFQIQPCFSIGYFRMQKASTNNWIVQTLNIAEGIGQFGEGINWTLPSGQNGATNGLFSSTVGGDTIPTFNTVSNNYTILRNGTCYYFIALNTITVDGVGAGFLKLALPINNVSAGARFSLPGTFTLESVAGAMKMYLCSNNSGTSFATFTFLNNTNTFATLTPGTLVTANFEYVYASLYYDIQAS